MIRISSTFDSGAIDVVQIAEETELVRVDVRIRRDSHQDFTQWFHFRLHGARGRRCVVRFLNAGECTYPTGWEGYAVVASDDRARWYRIPTTTYRDGVMTVDVVPARDDLYLAYFEPYDGERRLALLGRIAASPRARVVGLGTTADGRDLDCVDLAGGQDAERRVWVIARQHPGETMAEWFVEGLLERLVDESDPLAREALRLADFHVVPNMNPDGSARGNLRTNARGRNLNREWLEPSHEDAPEVQLVRERIESTGVDLFLDVHGDEGLPYVFVAGSEMLPDFSERQRADQSAFVASFKEASPDFQDRIGYPAGKYSNDALKLASKWVGHRFGCLSMTLEMPFKDNADAPDPRVGWNGERSKRLGAAVLHPIVQHLKRPAR
ncbi:MAG TPA: M14-type cytosolic carboxypeptidase [Polyangiaceae bacterium]|nr:M14-type cytosolic carboxypeptidase [Polyangiaceae bacterium]